MFTRRGVLERGSGLLGLGILGTGAGVGASSTAAGQAADETLFHVDFEDAALGDYEPDSRDWGGLPVDVASEEFLSVVEADDGRRVLNARFPEGVEGAGNTNGGGDFVVDLPEDYGESRRKPRPSGRG